MQKKITENNEYKELLKQYIEVFNNAIAENLDKFPYNHLLEGVLSCSDKGHEIHYVIYDKRPKASYKLKMDNGKLSISKQTDTPPEKFSSISYDYLKKVVDNADEYVKNPELLDWGWLNQ